MAIFLSAARGDVPGAVAGLTTADGTVYEAGIGERVIGGTCLSQILPFAGDKSLALYLAFEKTPIRTSDNGL